MKINRHQRGHCQLRENYVFWQELAHAKRPTHKKGAHQMRIHTLEKTETAKLKGLFDVYCEAFEEVHPFPSDAALQRLMIIPLSYLL